jgi:hypothetical protein
MPTLTIDRASITAEAVRRAALQALLITLAVGIALVALTHLDGHTVEAVRSALGKDAKAPANAKALEDLAATIQGNWYWFLLITLPLALSILLGALALGVRSASDWLFKLLLGIVGIIGFAPAIVA